MSRAWARSMCVARVSRALADLFVLCHSVLMRALFASSRTDPLIGLAEVVSLPFFVEGLKHAWRVCVLIVLLFVALL